MSSNRQYSPEQFEMLRRIGLDFGLPPTARAVTAHYDLQCENLQLRKDPLTATPTELGPWMIVKSNSKSVMSDDFSHDVLLRIDGDFGSDEQREQYRSRLVHILNLGVAALNAKLALEDQDKTVNIPCEK